MTLAPTTPSTRPPTSGTPTEPDLPRVIGFWGATGLMAGIMIGSGIFATPPDVARQMGNPWLILLMWIAGGALSLCGALTYAELAVMFPQSGGVYVFLREAYGRCVAFVFGWTYLLISKPVAAAGIAIVFAAQFNDLSFMRGFTAWFNEATGLTWDNRATTTVLLTVFTYINVRGVRLGTSVATVLTFFKALALAAIVVAAILLMKGSAANLEPGPAPVSPKTGLPIPLWAALVPVMFSVLWTYDGWSDVGAIAGEIKNPQRSLPRIYLAGTAVVTLLYVAVNAVYMWMIPLDQMRTVDNVAPMAAHELLGPAAATAIAIVVLVSAAGSTHGSIMTGARISYAQARDELLFGFLGKVHPVYKTPAVSLWMQLGLSLTALWFLGSFKHLADTFVFTMWIFYSMAAAAIFIFRRRLPDHPRPYRAWGYPVVPVLFIAAGVVMTVVSILQDPGRTLPWIAVLLAGVPVYFLWEKLRRRAGEARP
ncbi:MAG: Serine/threonine exchanger SteT [Phycisphaerales bacterium]|nr:Serine/threonine exchanger SteT [Phycisphaerales bacterium]